MRELTKLDKILILLGFLIVLGIFTLAFVIAFKGGTCVLNPCDYATSKNISCFKLIGLG
jgi:hypothetical protein